MMWRSVTVILVLTAVSGAAGRADGAEDRVVPWNSAYAPADRRVVRIGLLIRPSLRPQRVVLREDAGRIQITLLAEKDDRPSTANAVTDCVEVRLRARVGARRLFDRWRLRPRSGSRDGPTVLSGRSPCRRLRAEANQSPVRGG